MKIRRYFGKVMLCQTQYFISGLLFDQEDKQTPCRRDRDDAASGELPLPRTKYYLTFTHLTFLNFYIIAFFDKHLNWSDPTSNRCGLRALFVLRGFLTRYLWPAMAFVDWSLVGALSSMHV